MKVPCKYVCGINAKCRNAEDCIHWKYYVLESKKEREKNRKEVKSWVDH